MESMEKQDKQFEKMTTAPIPGLVSRLGIPAVISMLVSALYNSADAYFVSQLGTSAAGAVGIVFSLMAIIQAVGFTIGQGASSLISISLGKKDNEGANKLAGAALFAGLVFSVLVAALGLVFLSPLMRLLGATETILPFAEAYGRYILIGAPMMCLAFVCNNLLRAEGKTRFAMIGIVSGGLLNIALDPLFIFTLGLGTAGAAIATAISQSVSLAILLSCYFRKKTIVEPRMSKVSFKLPIYWQIGKTGFPALCRQGLSSVATILLNNAAALYGDAAVAAVSIVTKIFMLIFSVSLGIGQGYQPVCGYNYGAGLYGRVRKAYRFTLSASMAVMTVFAAVAFIFAETLLALFISDDPEVMRIGVYVLRAQCIAMPLVPFTVVCNMTFQSVGKPLLSTFLSCCRQGICFIPFILVLPRLLGLRGVQLAQACSDATTFLLALPVAIAFFRRLPKEDLN